MGKEPRCSKCKWHLKFRYEKGWAAGIDWEPTQWIAFCWNPKCKVNDINIDTYEEL